MAIFDNKTCIKLLNVLIENPLSTFKEVEIISKAKTGKGSAGNIINKLAGEKIIILKKIGKTKVISLNLLSPYYLLLKQFYDYEKLQNLPRNILASILLFDYLLRLKGDAKLTLIFGSCIAGTSTNKSDIDLLVVSNNQEPINQARKLAEGLLGERLNLHLYTLKEIRDNFKTDKFIQNAFFKGAMLYGHTFARDLLNHLYNIDYFTKINFFIDRINAAQRNYEAKDNTTVNEILNNTIEQTIYYLLAENNISFTSKRDAKINVMMLKQGKRIHKIEKSLLPNKIHLSKQLVLDILKDKIFEAEGYAGR